MMIRQYCKWVGFAFLFLATLMAVPVVAQLADGLLPVRLGAMQHVFGRVRRGEGARED